MKPKTQDKAPNFFKNWKENGFQKAHKDFIYYFNLAETPDKLLYYQLVGYIGMVIGTAAGIVSLIYMRYYAFAVVAFFSMFVLYGSMKQTYKQYKSYLEMKEMIQQNGQDNFI